MPRRPPARFTCQYSTAACSPPKVAKRGTQNTLAPKCASAAEWSTTSAASLGNVPASNASSHYEEHVHIVGFQFVRHARTEHHEPDQMPGGPGEAVDAVEAFRDSHPLSRARAETIEHLPQCCPVHTR